MYCLLVIWTINLLLNLKKIYFREIPNFNTQHGNRISGKTTNGNGSLATCSDEVNNTKNIECKSYNERTNRWQNSRWPCKTIIKFFFVVPSWGDIFLTTFYSPYFTHHLYITIYISYGPLCEQLPCTASWHLSSDLWVITVLFLKQCRISSTLELQYINITHHRHFTSVYLFGDN